MCACLAKKTKVTMADGMVMDISDVRLGDLVMNSEQHGFLRVINIWHSMEDKYLKIFTENNNELCVTMGHPIYQENGFIRAEQLEEGAYVYGLWGEKVKVISVKVVEEREKGLFCDLEFSEGADCGYAAEGIIVGNVEKEFELGQSSSN